MRREIRRGDPLSAYELEHMALMIEGFNNKEIAAQFCIGVDTVKYHITSIIRKLDARNRTHAVAKYLIANTPPTRYCLENKTGRGTRTFASMYMPQTVMTIEERKGDCE